MMMGRNACISQIPLVKGDRSVRARALPVGDNDVQHNVIYSPRMQAPNLSFSCSKSRNMSVSCTLLYQNRHL